MSGLLNNSLELDVVCPQWFLTLYSRNDNIELFLRTIDLLFITGTKALFQIALSYLDLLQKEGHLENFDLDAEISRKLIGIIINFRFQNPEKYWEIQS